MSEYDLSSNLIDGTFVNQLNNPEEIAASTANTVFVDVTNDGTVNKYDATSGQPVNYSDGSSKFSFGTPIGLTVSTSLYVGGNGIVSKYNQNGTPFAGGFTGTSNGSITGFGSPGGLVVAAGNLYVADKSLNTITKYSATTGAMLAFGTGGTSISVPQPLGAAFGSSLLFVSSTDPNTNIGTVTAYNANGVRASASGFGANGKGILTLGVNSNPTGLTISNGILYIVNSGSNSISTYDISNLTTNPQATAFNASFITTGLVNPQYLDIAAVPEPGTWIMMLLGGTAVLGIVRRRQQPTR